MSASTVSTIAACASALAAIGAWTTAQLVRRDRRERDRPQLRLLLRANTLGGKGTVQGVVRHLQGSQVHGAGVFISLYGEYLSEPLDNGFSEPGETFYIETPIKLQPVSQQSMCGTVMAYGVDSTLHAWAVDGRYRQWRPGRFVGGRKVNEKRILWRTKHLLSLAKLPPDQLLYTTMQQLSNTEPPKAQRRAEVIRHFLDPHPITGEGGLWRLRYFFRHSPCRMNGDEVFRYFYPGVEQTTTPPAHTIIVSRVASSGPYNSDPYAALRGT
jgi:hypothetical protein